MNSNTQKTILLIDAVEWDPIYPADHALHDVAGWYRTAMAEAGIGEVRLNSLRPDPEDPSGFISAVFDERPAALIISGSPRDAWAEDDPVNGVLCGLVLAARDAGLPFLGVCYGHQILARALGGRVRRHADGLQLGNVSVEITAAGLRSGLFDDMPEHPSFICGHADAVLEAPAGAEILASSPLTACQAMRCGDHMMGVQFHPEFTPEILRFLWTPRIADRQAETGFSIAEALENLRPTPHSTRLFGNFIRRQVIF